MRNLNYDLLNLNYDLLNFNYDFFNQEIFYKFPITTLNSSLSHPKLNSTEMKSDKISWENNQIETKQNSNNWYEWLVT